MMTRDTAKNREQIQFVSLDDLVPEEHLVRKLEAAIDWSFIYELVEETYSEDNVRPSLDPVTLIKLPILQYMFGIRSIREYYQLRKETIEHSFGLAKELHCFRYTQEYGKARMEVKAALTFACMNLKKLAKKRWKSRLITSLISHSLMPISIFTSSYAKNPLVA